MLSSVLFKMMKLSVFLAKCVKGTLKMYNTLSAQIANGSGEYATAPEEYANELYEALEQDDTDLAEYADEYHGDTYYKKLHKITITVEWVDGKLYGAAICEVSDDWTEEDTDRSIRRRRRRVTRTA